MNLIIKLELQKIKDIRAFERLDSPNLCSKGFLPIFNMLSPSLIFSIFRDSTLRNYLLQATNNLSLMLLSKVSIPLIFMLSG